MPTMTSTFTPGDLARDIDGVFPALVSAHQDGIYSGVRRLLPSAADAEDVAQETFVRAYRALKGYGAARIEQLAVRPWLWTIALNLCRNAARSRSRRPALVPLDRAGEQPDARLADEAALAGIPDPAWRRRLEALPAAMRTAVVLRHVVDLPYAEVATAMARPVGTVKADVHRAIGRLRDMLIEEREETS